MAKAWFVSFMTLHQTHIHISQTVRILSVSVTTGMGKPCVARFVYFTSISEPAEKTAIVPTDEYLLDLMRSVR
ncbi:MAG: hypothetical protein NVSMB27_11220 [Ktedonobacteraceae bacterium]